MSHHGPLALREVKKPPNALRIALSSAPSRPDLASVAWLYIAINPKPLTMEPSDAAAIRR